MSVDISSGIPAHWGAPRLVLNAEQVVGYPTVDRVDRGGIGYLTAYWMGRYFGYVSDEQANEPPDRW